MPSRYFPPPQLWSADGMVLVGGKLTVERLLDAYRHGIFPWPASQFEPMLWWSSEPRAIIPLDGLHVSRRLARRLRRGEFQTTRDTCFADVMAACGVGSGREDGTWITSAMAEAYSELHRSGHAHSVEIWKEGELVGGVYGVAIGGLFAAESMFFRVRDASKVALARLVEHLNARGYKLLDVQQWTPHTGRMGAVEVLRREYLRRLAEAIDLPVTFEASNDEARMTNDE